MFHVVSYIIVDPDERPIRLLFEKGGPDSPVHQTSLPSYFSKSFEYVPYPSFTKSSLGMNLSDAEFMQ